MTNTDRPAYHALLIDGSHGPVTRRFWAYGERCITVARYKGTPVSVPQSQVWCMWKDKQPPAVCPSPGTGDGR